MVSSTNHAIVGPMGFTISDSAAPAGIFWPAPFFGSLARSVHETQLRVFKAAVGKRATDLRSRFRHKKSWISKQSSKKSISQPFTRVSLVFSGRNVR